MDPRLRKDCFVFHCVAETDHRSVSDSLGFTLLSDWLDKTEELDLRRTWIYDSVTPVDLASWWGPLERLYLEFGISVLLLLLLLFPLLTMQVEEGGVIKERFRYFLSWYNTCMPIYILTNIFLSVIISPFHNGCEGITWLQFKDLFSMQTCKKRYQKEQDWTWILSSMSLKMLRSHPVWTGEVIPASSSMPVLF